MEEKENKTGQETGDTTCCCQTPSPWEALRSSQTASDPQWLLQDKVPASSPLTGPGARGPSLGLAATLSLVSTATQVASLTHVLATVLAGLLRGQLANKQGFQELAHEIQVRVEGMEDILESRRQW